MLSMNLLITDHSMGPLVLTLHVVEDHIQQYAKVKNDMPFKYM